jgi:hypothetical protein
MVKKTGLARKVQQQNSQDELWKKTEALLDAMGWQVEVNASVRPASRSVSTSRMQCSRSSARSAA